MSRKTNKKIEIGDTYGRWTVIGTSDKTNKSRCKYWLCQCSCDKHTIKEVSDASLKNGRSKSCGCLNKEIISNRIPANFKDLTGLKFNRLTVLQITDERTSDGKIKWFCQCECGNTTLVDTCSLKSGLIKSCGCLVKENPILQKENLIGKRFGALTVIEYAGHSQPTEHSKSRVLWRCLCDCGNECDIIADSLKSGHTQSCGCKNKNDLTGKTFGKLMVLRKDYVHTDKTHRQYYICKCECGTINSVRQDALVSGGTTNCGCVKHEIENLVGKVFGELKVIKFIEKKRYKNNNASTNLWLCECSCGNKIIVGQGNLKSGNTTSCGCIKVSKGEDILNNIYEKYNINYIKQYRFDDCKYKYRLPFDSYLPDYNCCVEFDGEQHYFPVDFGSKGGKWALNQFKENKKRDQIKNEYCKKQNIPLIRIPYWERDNMECFLFEEFKKLGMNIKEINKAS